MWDKKFSKEVKYLQCSSACYSCKARFGGDLLEGDLPHASRLSEYRAPGAV